MNSRGVVRYGGVGLVVIVTLIAVVWLVPSPAQIPTALLSLPLGAWLFAMAGHGAPDPVAESAYIQ